ncbi:MAG: methyltransferase domain-containing protein [Actinobacteria bacterium]|nr:methyltransferase domain-containing protein [Actinomycetota bacterium]
MAAFATAFPPSAVEWLTAAEATAVLSVGSASLSLARRLSPRASRFAVVDRTAEQLVAAVEQQPGLVAIVAAPDAIPFAPCRFDHVVVVDTLHRLPPRLALAEFARVLRPEGRLTVVHTARDDSVPWVRRLAGVVRRVDPTAMADGKLAATATALHDNPYFPMLTRREFRRWVPAFRADLLTMVRQLDGFADVEPAVAEQVLSEVGDLYDAIARVPDPLLLPYTVTCWQGGVDHTELTAPLETDDAGLRIRL